MTPVKTLLACTVAAAALLAAPTAKAEFTREDAYSTSPEAVEKAFTEANTAINAGKYADAIHIIGDLLASKPNHADALNLMGYAHRKLGRYEQAVAFYKQALENNPMHRGANEYLGQAYIEQGQPELAKPHLDTLKRACPLGCAELDKLKQSLEAALTNKG
jgi:tetratricopeptide (TPR) repeat protein